MREILRLTGKTCLYFEVESKTLLPDIFNELVFVRARTFPHFLKRKWDFEHDEEHFERAGDLSEVTDGNRGKLNNTIYSINTKNLQKTLKKIKYFTKKC